MHEDPDSLERAARETQRLRGGLSRGFTRDMLVSGVLPWLVVLALTRFGVPIVKALAISALVPIADGLATFARSRRLDGIGIINLAFIAGSIAVTLWTGDVHVALLKGAVLTGMFGLVCLGSLLAPKPLMFYLGRQMSTRGDATLIAEWNARWQFARFRGIMRLITAAWGLGFLAEVAVRVVVAYTFAPVVVLATAPFITYGVIALLATWTVVYSGAMRRKYASALDAAA
jgi:hypothetical protein